MNINRESFLAALKFARLGTAIRGETLEQSNAFVFDEGRLITFNDEIMTSAPSPLDFTAAVLADELLKLIDKFPDEEVDINLKGDEVIIKGARKEAGVSCFTDIQLPYKAVPAAGEWEKIGDNVPLMLQQAARVCGKDVTQELTMMVHVTPELIEACDNWRLFRATLPTGFPEEGLLPATSVMSLDGLDVKRVSINEGWAHFRTGSKQIVSIRCSKDKYHEQIDELLKLGDAEQVLFPRNLAEILSRTVVMMDVTEAPAVRIKLQESKLTVESRKDSGWYRERRKIKYAGADMEFDVNPKFLVELLQRTRKAMVNDAPRMKIETEDGVQFVVALVKPEEK